MKILIFCNSVSGLLAFRGMLINQLISQGNQVSSIIPVSQNDTETECKNELKKIGCNLIEIPIDRRGINPLKDSKLFFNYLKTIRKEKPDLVITYTIKPNIYGGIACRLAKVPYAVNITGLGTAFQNNGLVKKLVCFLYRLALKKAKVVFFENVENRDTIVNLGLVKKEKTKVLAGAGVDLEKFSYIDYPEDKGETRFLFIGRVMKEKGINELIEAMRKLKKEGFYCSLDIVGGFEENYADILNNCEKEGLLKYHGVQSDVQPFIANCHCFVLPSWHEGMANTNLECAASGRPVITSNIHGCLEAVVNGESGLLAESKNADSLYQVMKQFIELPYEKKIAMGKCGRRHMEEVFDKRKVVEETIKAII